MKSLSTIFLSSIPFTNAWNYASSGQDWADEFGTCGLSSQSPINLPINAKGDNFASTVEAPDMTFALSLNYVFRNWFVAEGDPANYYHVYGDGGSISLTKWDAVSVTGFFQRMEIHAPSDHRFEEEQRDLEL